ncbi:MAG: hypothetical protein WCF65_09630 [Parachlamydiaceae bacterium]
MNEIMIPKKLVPLIKAFSADYQSARLLIIEAAKAISNSNSSCYSLENTEPSEEEVESIIAMMHSIALKDTIEMIYGAQIISSHLMGLRLLSHDFPVDQTLGLKLLRFSNEAMIQLQKKKSGGVSQNVNITYNNAGAGQALIQTVLPRDELCQ